MKFHILTLFPAMFAGPFSESIIKRGVENGHIAIELHNIRDHATDRHRTTDDAPYGGGAGMVMKVDPLARCLEAIRDKSPSARVVLATPRGRLFTQARARELATVEELVIVCGRYEGVDERFSELFVDEEISIGDFVLTGGELAAMVLVDSVSRLVPGVLGCADSAADESFSAGLLEYPQYTRPPEFRGVKVPEVLLSGNHAQVARWRQQEALRRTLQVRPDLLATAPLTRGDEKFLAALQAGEEQ